MNSKIISLKALIALIIAIGIIALLWFVLNPENTQSTSVNGENAGTSVGDNAPFFSVETTTGDVTSLADFANDKVLVITSTASWCPTCRLEANNLSPVYEQFSGQVDFLSMSIDPSDNQEKLTTFRSETNTPWIYSEPNLDGASTMIIDYQLTRFEVTYIIDKNSVIRFKDTGVTATDTLTEELEKVLAET
ncbi:TlpA family protein disulfide reductase [Patescibacteria group bacterium]